MGIFSKMISKAVTNAIFKEKEEPLEIPQGQRLSIEEAWDVMKKYVDKMSERYSLKIVKHLHDVRADIEKKETEIDIRTGNIHRKTITPRDITEEYYEGQNRYERTLARDGRVLEDWNKSLDITTTAVKLKPRLSHDLPDKTVCFINEDGNYEFMSPKKLSKDEITDTLAPDVINFNKTNYGKLKFAYSAIIDKDYNNIKERVTVFKENGEHEYLDSLYSDFDEIVIEIPDEAKGAKSR